MKNKKIALILIVVLLINVFTGQGANSVIHATSVKVGKQGCMTFFYECCEESPEYDWSYSFMKVPGEKMPYFMMRAEPVDDSGLDVFYLKSPVRTTTIKVEADELCYGNRYIMAWEAFLKYKGMYRIKVNLYRLSRNKIVKYHGTKMIKGKTQKKMFRNLNKWLTKRIHERRRIIFNPVKWKY